MIPILDLLFDIDTKLNRLANLRGQYIPNETKIEVLNIVQQKLVLKKIDINNNYQLGLGSFSKRYEDLQGLIVPYEELPMTVTGDVLNSYKVPQLSLAFSMIIPVNAYVLATKGNCKDRIIDVIDIMKHGDIRLLLKSPHYIPRFNYQETVGSISSDVIYVYSDEKGSFSISKLYLTYLRYPMNMDIAGYVHLDGSSSSTVDCELEPYLKNELVDLAVEEIADATANQEQSQLSRARTKENE